MMQTSTQKASSSAGCVSSKVATRLFMPWQSAGSGGSELVFLGKAENRTAKKKQDAQPILGLRLE